MQEDSKPKNRNSACDGVVVDAHVMRDARDQLALKSGDLYDVVSWVIDHCGIAITPRIKEHWERHCGTDQFFWEWYTDQFVRHAIRFVPVSGLPPKEWKSIVGKFRMPADPYVKEYVACAHFVNAPKYILSEDPLLHDPAVGSAGPGRRAKILSTRTGRFCVYLERQLGIRVGIPADYGNISKHCPARQPDCIS